MLYQSSILGKKPCFSYKKTGGTTDVSTVTVNSNYDSCSVLVSLPDGYIFDASISKGFPESSGCVVSNALQAGGDVVMQGCTEKQLDTGENGRLYYQIIQPKPYSGDQMVFEFTPMKGNYDFTVLGEL